VYYLPRLASLKTDIEINTEIISTAKIILPIVALLALIIFLNKHLIVKILFSDDFKPMLPLFKYQLIGDVIKIVSWLLAYQMLAKRMTKVFILSEIFFSSSFILLSIYFVKQNGLGGVSVAFCLNTICYLIFLIFFFRKKIFLIKF
jgi:PST family polysaccharide transporter